MFVPERGKSHLKLDKLAFPGVKSWNNFETSKRTAVEGCLAYFLLEATDDVITSSNMIALLTAY